MISWVCGIPCKSTNNILCTLTSYQPSRKTWLSVHFRWGDVSTDSVESPNPRAGAGLSTYIDATKRQLEKFDDPSKVQVHFFSEGEPSTFESFQIAFPTAKLHLESASWVETLDIISQSKILIGGGSTFFVLAAGLCEECTIVAVNSSAQRYFSSHDPSEALLAQHHNVEFYLG